jgi:ubiquinone/menaquinone biosynthesis C-methylase UbiE
LENQKSIFTSFESDNWFLRNREALENKKEFIDMDELIPFVQPNFSILEIGCSNGTKLNYLKNKLPHHQLKFFGIDPSTKSVNDGNEKFGNISLSVGSSDELNFEEDYFDMIIVGFCLYLVDRNLIFKTVSEIDRVLKQKGFLIVTDFEPIAPMRKIYHHTEGVYTYKNNYSNFFTSGGHYSVVRKVPFSDTQIDFAENKNERVASTILYKEKYEDVYALSQ